MQDDRLEIESAGVQNDRKPCLALVNGRVLGVLLAMPRPVRVPVWVELQ